MKPVWLIFLSVILFSGLSFSAYADVTGSFNLDLTMLPEGTQTEAVKFEFDLFSNLQFTSTFSGIRFGADLGFGTTGIEFAILKLSFTLGAISWFDENVFATPFGCTLFTGAISEDAPGFDGQCRAKFVVPIGDLDGDGQRDPNPVAFVKKRTLLEMNIGGVQFTNLMLFEDIDFPDIQGGIDHEHDHFDGSQTYDLSQQNPDHDDFIPSFVLGDVVGFSGQTVSGITVRSETAICAEGKNYIKRRMWDIEVSKRCVDYDISLVWEGLAPPLAVDEQRLWLEGLGSDLFGLDIFAQFNSVARSFYGTVTTTSTVAELAELKVVLAGGSAGIAHITAQLTSANVTLIAIDVDGDISLDEFTGIFNLYVDAGERGLVDSSAIVKLNTSGLTDINLLLGFGTTSFIVNSNTHFASDGTGGLQWASTSFGMSSRTLGIEFGADFGFSQSGISDIHAAIGFTF
jgi:hypothetical protein